MQVPGDCIKPWDVGSHYFSKIIDIKFLILSKFFKDTCNITKNDIIHTTTEGRKLQSEPEALIIF